MGRDDQNFRIVREQRLRHRVPLPARAHDVDGLAYAQQVASMGIRAAAHGKIGRIAHQDRSWHGLKQAGPAPRLRLRTELCVAKRARHNGASGYWRLLAVPNGGRSMEFLRSSHGGHQAQRIWQYCN